MVVIMFIICSSGYSDKIDSLRDKMRENESSVNDLIESLRSTYASLPKMSLVPHKGYIRVLEVTKSQAHKAENCPDLIWYYTKTRTHYYLTFVELATNVC